MNPALIFVVALLSVWAAVLIWLFVSVNAAAQADDDEPLDDLTTWER